METEENKNIRKKVLIGISIFGIFLLAIFVIANISALNNWVGSVLLLFRPVLIGLVLAYICNPIFRFFERKVLSRMRPHALRRPLSLILTYITIFLILILILLLIVPQLIENIITFVSNYNRYISAGIEQINGLFSHVNALVQHLTGNDTFIEYLDEAELRKQAADFFAGLEEGSANLLTYLSELDIKPIQDFLGNAVSIVTDSIFGIFVSLYLLSTKEKRYAQIMKLRRAMFSDTVNENITRLCRLADRSFGGWFEGKLLDCLLIGLLTYIVFLIFHIPYALLISSIIAVANIIPVIGLIIGAVPAAIILLLSAPGKVIPFLIIVFAIQQIDNNIIGPKILGNNTGVSSLCVMIAITTMGTLWGPVGMILGVPLFATVIALIDSYLTDRLQKKGMPSGLANYYANDAIVDPAKNAHLTIDKSVQKFEKKALHIRKKKESGEQLSSRERAFLAVYRLVHKYHFFSEISDETQIRFSAEQAASVSLQEADDLICRRRSPLQPQEEVESDTEVSK